MLMRWLLSEVIGEIGNVNTLFECYLLKIYRVKDLLRMPAVDLITPIVVSNLPGPVT
jgi:hypothetical protein